MTRKTIFIFSIIAMLSGCYLLEKSTKNFPKLKISYIPKGNKIFEDNYGVKTNQKYLFISSNIDIENEALKKDLTISYKDFSCLFDREMLEKKRKPYKTIGGYFSNKEIIKDNYFIYNLSIFTTENEIYHYELPQGFPENLKEKKDSDILYCQYIIYFYMAKPVVKSNIIEIPFKDIREILEK